MKILGTCISTPEYNRDEIKKKVEKVGAMQRNAAAYPNPADQDSAALQQLRRVQDDVNRPHYPDRLQRSGAAPVQPQSPDAFNTAFSYSFTDREWTVMTFSISQGGHGARNISTVAKAANLARYGEAKSFLISYFLYI